MDKMKLETIDMYNIHIADLKDWKGKDLDLTEERVEEAIRHFNNGEVEPYLNLDHNPGMTEATRQFFKAMGLGFVKGLRREGKKLMADFKQVPKLIGELINVGALKQRSIEFWKDNFPHADGRKLNNVLEAVTFHGGNGLPAMNTLADIPKLFKSCDVGDKYKIKSIEQSTSGRVSLPCNFKQEVKMTEQEQKEFDQLIADNKKLSDDSSKVSKEIKEIKMKLDKSDTSDEVTKMKSVNDDLTTENEKLKKEAEDKEAVEMKNKKEAEVKQLENDKVEAKIFVTKIIDDKKLLPKYSEMEESNYIKFKNDPEDKDGKNFIFFKEKLENSDEVMDFSKKTENLNEDNTDMDSKSIAMKNEQIMMKQNGEYNPKKLGAAYNDVNDAVKVIMKNNPEMDFIAASDEFNKRAEGEATL